MPEIKYFPTAKGFISNAPKLNFLRCDGTFFYSDTGTTGNMSMTDNDTAVYGGWGKAPIGFVPGESGMEFSYTDAQFYADVFTVASTAKTQTKDYGVLASGNYIAETGSVVKLPFEVDTASVKVNGLT